MIIKYWRISVLKNGKPVTLFTTTTDMMVEKDLSEDTSNSLIYIARQFHRHPQTTEQNHRDLAIGAVMAHASVPHFDCDNAHIGVADSVPNVDPVAYVGGSRSSRLVPIWEELDGFE